MTQPVLVPTAPIILLPCETSPPAEFVTSTDAAAPLLPAMIDETYTLTAPGEGPCSASDFLQVTILKPVNVPNAVTPNGAGVHESWKSTNRSEYPGCAGAIFNG